ncbi:hypothetical protein VTJ49DRAFT_3106 [Mycothermus thermophilus]|uniref:F-box domain-containing protein n=1 Tax=Humicola insolens TaxID=85995 RepID=A0ABR3V8C2_HUMIN
MGVAWQLKRAKWRLTEAKWRVEEAYAKTRRSSRKAADKIRRGTQKLLLTDLPTEILTLILGHFCMHCRDSGNPTVQAFFPSSWGHVLPETWYDDDRRALRNACLTSRRLGAVAQHILHHVFLQDYAPSNPDLSPPPEPQWTPRVSLFLRTLAARPDLAAAVRHFHIASDGDYVTRGTDELILLPPPGPTPIRPLGFEEEEEAKVTLNHRLPPRMACVARILARTRNLQTISMSHAMWTCKDNLRTALLAAGVRELGVRRVDVCNVFPRPWETAWVVLEFAAGSVRELAVHGKDVLVEMGKWRLPGRRLEGLWKLTVTGAKVKGKDELGVVLERLGCEKLKELKYEPVIRLRHYNSYLSPYSAKVLLKNQRTLRSLHLDFQTRDYLTSAADPTSPCLEYLDLPNFPVLEDLFLNTLLLFTRPEDYKEPRDLQEDREVLTRILPPSIVRLRLVDGIVSGDLHIRVWKLLSRALEGLAEAVNKGRFPKLRSVWYDTAHSLQDRRIQGEFGANGVEFEWKDLPISRSVRRRDRD